MNVLTMRHWAVPAPWRAPLLAWSATVVLLLLVYRETAVDMVDIWYRSETFAHAFVVPLLSVWVAWRIRGSVAGLQPKPALWMAVPLALMAALWQLGDLVQVAALEQFMLVGMLVGTVPAVLGWQAARALMFPLGFLFFAVPFGEFLTPLLVQHTADFTVAAVRLSGVPVFREGNQFVIPSGRWSVVEACSGIRYLVASLMVGTLFAYLNYSSLRRRLAFVAVSIVVPIVANWLRAYMIVMIGHLSDNRLATGVDHLIYGWVFFGLVIMTMFMVGARWADSSNPLSVSVAAHDRLVELPVGQLASAVLLVAAAVGGLHLAASEQVHGVTLPAVNSSTSLRWPAQLGAGWRADVKDQVGLLTPTFVGAANEGQQLFAGPDGAVWVYMARYPVQDDQRKLISSVNGVVRSGDPRWNLLSSKAGRPSGSPAALSGVRMLTAIEADHGNTGARQNVRAWQFYWIGGRATDSDIEAKLLQAWQRLRGRGSAGTVIVIYTLDEPGGTADRRLDAFLKANFTSLTGWLDAFDAPA